MQTKETISSRRTIHTFLDEEIDLTLVMQALELALTAPNHKFTFPFKFLVLGKEVRQKLADNLIRTMELKNGPPKDDLEAKARTDKAKAKLLHPATIVAFVLPKSEDSFQEREDYATIACAVQNFALALKDEGWDCKWSSGSVTKLEETHIELGLNVKKEEIVAFVKVGHSAVPLKPRRRPQISDVTTVLK